MAMAREEGEEDDEDGGMFSGLTERYKCQTAQLDGNGIILLLAVCSSDEQMGRPGKWEELE